MIIVTFCHLLSPFLPLWSPFVTFNPARDYPQREHGQRKTVSFTLFSAVFLFPEVLAGSLETVKSVKSVLFLMLFSDY